MRFRDRYFCVRTLIAAVVVLSSSSPARACLNTGTLEPCHCIQDMMITAVTPAGTVTTQTISGAPVGAAVSPAVTQGFYVGDRGSTNSFYSVNANGIPGGANTIIHAGDTITWTMSNTATTFHTITTVDQTIPSEAFDHEVDLPGDTFSHTFLTPGTYYYYCTNHDGYNGYVNGVPQFFGSQHATVTVLPAPEPGSIAVLGIAGVALLLRRRRTSPTN